MEIEHSRIEELLAGYALRSLSGEDAREADRLLSQHVPGCATCRATLGDFQELMGDLALGADPAPPPEMLLPRLHREMGPALRRRRPGAMVAAAASIVVVVGMAGLAVGQGIRASNADQRRDLFSEALQLASRPDASKIPLLDTQTSGPPVTEIMAPGVEVLYLVCQNVARPRPGMTYRIWYGSGGSFTFVSQFAPEPDLTVLRLQFDPGTVDRIIITEEPIGRAPTQPVAATIRWSDAA
jgi:hypothetical protein